MTVRVLAAGEEIATSREEPVVAIVCPGHGPGAAATLRSISSQTPPGVPILLVGASVGAVGEAGTGAHEILALEPEGDAREGWAGAANAAREATRGDLVLVQAGVEVGGEWLERLRRAALSDSTVVSATALGDRAGALSVPAPAGRTQAWRAVMEGSPRAYPRIEVAGAHCVYLRRALLERLGPWKTEIEDPAEAMAELSLRATRLGMVQVAADDVYVSCPPGQGPPGAPERAGGDPAEDERTVLRRSLACARMALGGLSVTIDARTLGTGVGGTQQYTAELVAALAGGEGPRVRVVVAPDLSPAVTGRFAEMGGLEIVTYAAALAGRERTDIVHRPQQVFTADDLRLLQLLGERVIVGQQDLIAYRNPAYHASPQAWGRYRRVTRMALTAADRVVFFSEHARADAVAEDLLAPGRGDVVGIGADGLGGHAPPAPVAMAVAGVPPDRELLVCVGADYAHKNRPFAMALLGALRERHGWEGCLVLAGGHVEHGSSRAEEAELLAGDPGLAERVIDVGAIGEGEKRWLYERAGAVVYPTLYEGFGLVPFEAARAGAPCLFAPQTSLVELAGAGAATLIPWNAELSSDAVVGLLQEGPERRRHVEILREAAARSRWSDVVAGLRETWERALRSPWRAAAPRAWEELERERFIGELEDVAGAYQEAYHDLEANVGIGLPLVAEGGLLSRDEQRGLMRVASRKALHGLLLAPLGLLGRLGARRDARGRW